MAQLDQLFAQANQMYGELIEMLVKLTGEHGIYEAMAIMGKSLEIASRETLVSMVLTGMRRDMHRGEKEKDA